MVQDAIAGLEKALGAERITSCNCLVKNYSKRKNVGTRIGLRLANRFGRHVIYCSRELRAGLSTQSRFRLAGKVLSHNKVQDLDLARCSQHDIFRLDVVMNDTRIVCRGQGQGTLRSDGQEFDD